MPKAVFIVRQDENREYDEAQRDAYISRLQAEGKKFTVTHGVQRNDGHLQTEITEIDG